MSDHIMNLKVDPLIIDALNEDITDVDISAQIFSEKTEGNVKLIAKQDGVLAGLFVFKRVFQLVEEDAKIESYIEEGQSFKNGDVIALVQGRVSTLLTCERVALNFLQRMSGIATKTAQMVEQLSDSGILLMDTRKTTPGLRVLEKYAVRMGGGHNHRYNLSDMIMLKDNHINAAGGVKEAVHAAKKRAPYIKKIEVEVENLEMVAEAVEAKADIIMLDNFDFDELQRAIKMINKQAIIEVSGNITTENIGRYTNIGIDYISSGAITHSAGIVDLSMKELTIN